MWLRLQRAGLLTPDLEPVLLLLQKIETVTLPALWWVSVVNVSFGFAGVMLQVRRVILGPKRSSPALLKVFHVTEHNGYQHVTSGQQLH